MMRSLSSAVGGLRAHQTKMDVIGNNIANVNTYGFKSSRVTFSDVYYQTLSGGSAPSGNLGGTNPTQIGYGAMVASIDVLNTQSSGQSTDRAMDIYINGDGYITVKDADNNIKYTRAGVLGFDSLGNLVDVNGNVVQGIALDENGNPNINPNGTIEPDSLVPITVANLRDQLGPDMDDDPVKILDKLTNISIGSKGDITGLLPGDAEIALTKGLPGWLADITIDPKSNLVGNVTVTLEERYTYPDGTPMPANWITNIETVSNSGLSGTYSFSFDSTSNTLTAISTTGSILTGSYTRGGDVLLRDMGGNLCMVVSTDATIQASDSSIVNPMTFSTSWRLSVTGTNKGGATETAFLDYTNPGMIPGSVTINDVTLAINRSGITTANKSSFTMAATAPSGINGIYIDPDSTMFQTGPIDIEVGTFATISSYVGGTNSFLNFLNATEIETALETWAMANGYQGSFRIEVDEPAAGVFTFEIFDDSNTSIGTLGGLGLGSATIAAGTGTGVLGGALTITNFPGLGSATPPANYTLANSTIKNMVRVSDGATPPNSYEVEYLSGSTVKLGDMILSVNEGVFATHFPGYTPGVAITNPTSTAVLGQFLTQAVEQWAFDGKGGTAQSGAGQSVTIGIIALGYFPNALALEQDGNSYFVQSANTGEAQYARPSTNGTGGLTAGYLEMSNVDISKEFTDMITTQRGFQANTRIITVSDEMLQELVNIKR